MFDKLIEKGQMLAFLGSFWSKTLEDDASYVPHKLTHLPFITQVLGKFSTICRIALGQGRISTGQYVIRFSDSDIQGNILLIDRDTMVTSVYQDDSIIAKDAQFKSGYGFIEFEKDPRALFPKMRIQVRQAIRRVPNILNYPLGTWGVVGDTSQIVEYYRNNQSPRQLYKASAQACGMIVVKHDDTIIRRVDLADDKTVYITALGERYDAWYEHTRLSEGDNVHKGQVIGSELYSIYTTYNDLDGVDMVELGYACPVASIKIPNQDIILYKDGVFKPDYIGDDLETYWKYLEDIGSAEKPAEQPDSDNALRHFMEKVAPNRCIVVKIDTNMSQDMRNRLYRFIIANAPIGSVVLTACH